MLFETPAADGVTPPVRDLDARDLAVLGAFAVAIVWLGVAPSPLLRRMEGPVQRLVSDVHRESLVFAPRAVPLAAAPADAGRP
jgi:NADH:ubiquinone oxidoreductase subunit 4 (subunit M)